MPVSRSLRRLFRIRELEEEQSRQALDASLAELRRLELALRGAAQQGRRGREIVDRGLRAGSLNERIAGLEEEASAERLSLALGIWIHDLQSKVDALREVYRMKSLERRQAETLVDEVEMQSRIDAARREQAGLDDWYGNRTHARKRGEPRSSVESGRGEPSKGDGES
jgi:predicted GIY-YIG superfamily endonuclease